MPRPPERGAEDAVRRRETDANQQQGVVEFCVLGRIAVIEGGREHTLGSTREAALLADLLVHANQVVSSSRLIADVWRNEPPPAAKATLHSHIRNLRRVLEPGRTAGTSSVVLVTRPPGYEIRVAADRVDAWRFERLADEARAALDDGDPRSAADRYRAALALWRGAAYGDLADEEFVQSEAARLEALRLVAIEQRVQADLDLGRHAELCGELSALVKDNPYRERFWGQLMLAQYRSGRQTDALRTYRQVRSQLGEELGIEPGQDLRDLDEAIVQHHPGLDWSADPGHDVSPPTPPPEDRARHNLPAGLTRFVGRDDERRHLVEELATHRLVTVTGVGGVGKTRLAAEIASSLIDVHADGVWMVELAPIADPADVPGAVASALSIPIQPGMNTVESIVDWMRGRRLLLVVDNCEHVVTAAVELVGAIVARCPTVTMLTTSREPLGIPGERVHRLQPLDPGSHGMELLVDRAMSADLSFAPSAAELEAMVAICRRLDGVPLAIELAAARIRSISPIELLVHLDDHFRLLDATGRGLAERHRTLRATVIWSYRLMTHREQLVFDRVSVFAGGFDLAAVEAVTADDDVDEIDVVNIVASLVDKSMIVADRTEIGVRYRVLQTLRGYGEERLRVRHDTAERRSRHLAHYVEVARETNRTWASPRQAAAGAVFDREWDNLRAAHGWALTTNDLDAADELVASTGPHAWCRMIDEHGDWAERNLDLDTADRHPRASSFGWAAWWWFVRGDPDRSNTVAHRGIETAPGPAEPDNALCWAVLVGASLAVERRTEAAHAARMGAAAAADNPDLFVQAFALAVQIDLAFHLDISAVAVHLPRLVSLAERVGAPSLLAWAAFHSGRSMLWIRDPPEPDRALATYREGRELARATGDVRTDNLMVHGIVFAETSLRVPRAAETCCEAINQFRRVGALYLMGLTLVAVACWFALGGYVDDAAIIFGHLDAHHLPYSDIDRENRGRQSVRRHPDVDDLMARGAAMDREQLLTFVLDRLAHTTET